MRKRLARSLSRGRKDFSSSSENLEEVGPEVTFCDKLKKLKKKLNSHQSPTAPDLDMGAKPKLYFFDQQTRSYILATSKETQASRQLYTKAGNIFVPYFPNNKTGQQIPQNQATSLPPKTLMIQPAAQSQAISLLNRPQMGQPIPQNQNIPPLPKPLIPIQLQPQENTRGIADRDQLLPAIPITTTGVLPSQPRGENLPTLPYNLSRPLPSQTMEQETERPLRPSTSNADHNTPRLPTQTWEETMRPLRPTRNNADHLTPSYAWDGEIERLQPSAPWLDDNNLMLTGPNESEQSILRQEMEALRQHLATLQVGVSQMSACMDVNNPLNIKQYNKIVPNPRIKKDLKFNDERFNSLKKLCRENLPYFDKKSGTKVTDFLIAFNNVLETSQYELIAEKEALPLLTGRLDSETAFQISKIGNIGDVFSHLQATKEKLLTPSEIRKKILAIAQNPKNTKIEMILEQAGLYIYDVPDMNERLDIFGQIFIYILPESLMDIYQRYLKLHKSEGTLSTSNLTDFLASYSSEINTHLASRKKNLYLGEETAYKAYNMARYLSRQDHEEGFEAGSESDEEILSKKRHLKSEISDQVTKALERQNLLQTLSQQTLLDQVKNREKQYKPKNHYSRTSRRDQYEQRQSAYNQTQPLSQPAPPTLYHGLGTPYPGGAPQQMMQAPRTQPPYHPPHPQQPRDLPTSSTQPNGQSRFCTICKKTNHFTETCWRKTTCSLCGGSHPAQFCRRIICDRCGSEHPTRNCNRCHCGRIHAPCMACRLCGNPNHKSVTCNLYPQQEPTDTPCASCRAQFGRPLYHNQANCRGPATP